MALGGIQMWLQRGVGLRNSVPLLELNRAFGACQWWLSKSWLNDSTGTHPMQLLWRETGWAADVECYLIGQAVYQLHKNGTKRNAFEEKRIEFLGTQSGNQRGYLFELLTALLLLAGGNYVRLLAASAKGYDLDIRTPNGFDIQVSCKVVQPSELYKKFIDDAHKSRDSLVRAMNATRQQGITGIYGGEAYNAGFVSTEEWIQCLAPLTHNGQLSRFTGERWTIFSGKDRLIEGTSGYSRKYPSYTFLASATMDVRAEMKRITAKIGEANRKFKKHAPLRKLNITFVRIPEYITLDDVESAVRAQFNTGRFTNTSAVVVVQSSISKLDTDQGPIAHTSSYRFIDNQNALEQFPSGFNLNMVLPIGVVSNVTPNYLVGTQSVKPNEYMFMDKVQHVVVPLGSIQQGSGIPGVRRITQWEGTDLTMEMPMVPMDFRLL